MVDSCHITFPFLDAKMIMVDILKIQFVIVVTVDAEFQDRADGTLQ